MFQNVLKSKDIMLFTAYSRENLASSLLARSFRVELDHEERYLGSIPRCNLMFQLHHTFEGEAVRGHSGGDQEGSDCAIKKAPAQSSYA